MSSRKPVVWQFVTMQENANLSKCNKCSKLIRNDPESTFNCRHHLKVIRLRVFNFNQLLSNQRFNFFNMQVCLGPPRQVMENFT